MFPPLPLFYRGVQEDALMTPSPRLMVLCISLWVALTGHNLSILLFLFSQRRQRSHKEDSIRVCGGQSEGGSRLCGGQIQPTFSGKLQSGSNTVEPGRVSTAAGITSGVTPLKGPRR